MFIFYKINEYFFTSSDNSLMFRTIVLILAYLLIKVSILGSLYGDNDNNLKEGVIKFNEIESCYWVISLIILIF